MIRSLLALSMFLTAAETAAQAPNTDVVRRMLGAIDSGPSALEWQALGPETVPLLEAIYRDTTVPAHVRFQALSALRHFPTPETRAFLLTVARESGQSDLHIRQALTSLGHAFGDSAVTDVSTFMAHTSSVVREGAALSLGRNPSALAQRTLRARLPVEPSPVVRMAIERALQPVRR